MGEKIFLIYAFHSMLVVYGSQFWFIPICSHQNVVTIDVHAAKNLLNSSDYSYLDVR